MCYKSLIFLTLCVATLIFIGCGGDEEIPIGEEVVVDKWIEPEDIGKDYTVEVPNVGDTVLLSTGGQYTVTGFDVINLREQGTLISTLTNVRPDPENPNAFLYDEKIPRGYVVPEGPPIVTLYSDDLYIEATIGRVTSPHIITDFPVRKHNNVQQRDRFISTIYSVGIDRVLDHHLLVYVEYQALESPEFGGEMVRGRQLILIPKGETLIRAPIIPPDHGHQEYDKISVRVLPYTDMNDVELPVEVDNFDRGDGFSQKDITVVVGHTFRPYRIASSSFLMQQVIPTESNW